MIEPLSSENEEEGKPPLHDAGTRRERGGLQNELSRQAAGRTTQLVPGIGCTSPRRLETRAEREGRENRKEGGGRWDDEDHDNEKLPLD